MINLNVFANIFPKIFKDVEKFVNNNVIPDVDFLLYSFGLIYSLTQLQEGRDKFLE